MRTSRIRFEAFELDLHTGELRKEGNRVQLQDQPTRLLTLLANRPGELITRDEIQSKLWKDGEFVEFEHAVNTAIHKIRVALEDKGEKPRIIETLPKKGYRFIAAVNILEAAPERPSPPSEVAPSPPGARTESGGDSFVLPISVTWLRILFLLAQLPYVATYLAIFYYWDELDTALINTFSIPVTWSRPSLLILALVGFSVRIYLIGLVGWGHTDAGPRYRKLFPFLLVIDGFWAATPLLLHESFSPLVAWAGLILMGWLVFGQRTLMGSIERNSL